MRKLLLVLAVSTCATPAVAQSTRTWVSGVGDDGNTCSRTAPCKTFTGAIARTAAGGEINCLDPGGFGPVNITKSITIDCTGTLGAILAGGTNGVVVNGSGIVVHLRGLSIQGNNTGLSGVRVLLAAAVLVEDSKILGFSNAGIDVAPTGGGVVPALVVKRSSVSGNGVGIRVAPLGGAAATLALDDVTLARNSTGLSLTASAAVTSTVSNSFITSNTGIGVEAVSGGGGVNLNIDNTTISLNGTGLSSSGNTSVVRIGLTRIEGNVTGVNLLIGGQLQSFNNNFIQGNGVPGEAPTLTLNPN
jgi:hypothetical protein